MPEFNRFIILSDRTYRHLDKFAIKPVRKEATPLQDGFWQVFVDDEVINEIANLRQKGETDDQVIWRKMYAAFFVPLD